MAANRFASLSDEELQALLEDHDSKTYKNKQTNTYIQKQQKHLIYLKKKTYIYRHKHSGIMGSVQLLSK